MPRHHHHVLESSEHHPKSLVQIVIFNQNNWRISCVGLCSDAWGGFCFTLNEIQVLFELLVNYVGCKWAAQTENFNNSLSFRMKVLLSIVQGQIILPRSMHFSQSEVSCCNSSILEKL